MQSHGRHSSSVRCEERLVQGSRENLGSACQKAVPDLSVLVPVCLSRRLSRWQATHVCALDGAPARPRMSIGEGPATGIRRAPLCPPPAAAIGQRGFAAAVATVRRRFVPQKYLWVMYHCFSVAASGKPHDSDPRARLYCAWMQMGGPARGGVGRRSNRKPRALGSEGSPKVGRRGFAPERRRPRPLARAPARALHAPPLARTDFGAGRKYETPQLSWTCAPRQFQLQRSCTSELLGGSTRACCRGCVWPRPHGSCLRAQP